MNSVYALIDPRTSHVCYVGVTMYPKARLSQHCGAKNPSKVCEWVQSLKSEGVKPEMVVLESNLSTVQSRLSESFWLEYLRFLGAELTNMRKGGGGGAVFDSV